MNASIPIGLLWRWYFGITTSRFVFEALSLHDWDDAIEDSVSMLILVFSVTTYHVALPLWMPVFVAWKRSWWPSAR